MNAQARLLGESEALQAVIAKLPTIAAARRTTLICGPTGSGKEVVAASLHRRAFPGGAPYVAVHCGALPEHVAESELFGHTRGAFTGAAAARKGLVRSAAGGTLFLDEIDSLSLPVQAKLLRFVENGEYRSIGSDRSECASVWVLAATNTNLQRRVAEGGFRQDLYYRLDVMRLELPPLRMRAGDIELLARHFLAETQRSGKRFSALAIQALRGHDWPGNVRELKHRVERAALMAKAPVLEPKDLGLCVPPEHGRRGPRTPLPAGDIWGLIERDGLTLSEAMSVCERRLIDEALRLEGHNRTRAAARLGIHVRTMFKKLQT